MPDPTTAIRPPSCCLRRTYLFSSWLDGEFSKDHLERRVRTSSWQYQAGGQPLYLFNSTPTISETVLSIIGPKIRNHQDVTELFTYCL